MNTRHIAAALGGGLLATVGLGIGIAQSAAAAPSPTPAPSTPATSVPTGPFGPSTAARTAAPSWLPPTARAVFGGGEPTATIAVPAGNAKAPAQGGNDVAAIVLVGVGGLLVAGGVTAAARLRR
jgi:hypothetical protein